MKFYYDKDTKLIYEHCFFDEDTKHADCPYIELTEAEWNTQLQSHPACANPYYIDGKIVFQMEENKKNKIDAENKIVEISTWFDSYDMQVKQAERSLRLKEEPDIHIGSRVYSSLEELDTEAKEKAKELKSLRQK